MAVGENHSPAIYRRNYVLTMNDTTQIFDRQGTFNGILRFANYCQKPHSIAGLSLRYKGGWGPIFYYL